MELERFIHLFIYLFIRYECIFVRWGTLFFLLRTSFSSINRSIGLEPTIGSSRLLCIKILTRHFVCIRMIQQAFIDMENMFDLLAQSQEVRPLFFSWCDDTVYYVFFLFQGEGYSQGSVSAYQSRWSRLRQRLVCL